MTQVQRTVVAGRETDVHARGSSGRWGGYVEVRGNRYSVLAELGGRHTR